MRVSLVRIGNSRGIRLPKSIIEELALGSELEMVIVQGKLVLSAVAEARTGWEEAFRLVAERGEDQLVHGEQIQASSWDQDEWEW